MPPRPSKKPPAAKPPVAKPPVAKPATPPCADPVLLKRRPLPPLNIGDVAPAADPPSDAKRHRSSSRASATGWGAGSGAPQRGTSGAAAMLAGAGGGAHRSNLGEHRDSVPTVRGGTTDPVVDIISDDDVPFARRRRPRSPNPGVPSGGGSSQADEDDDEAEAPGVAASTTDKPIGGGERWTSFSGYQSCGEIALDQRRYKNTNRLIKVANWLLTVYDLGWATGGIPYKSGAELPPSVSYICGQPEYNTTFDPVTKQRRQHFQGFVSFHAATNFNELCIRLGLQRAWARPAGQNGLGTAIEYTKKEESAVLGPVGQSQWKEFGAIQVEQLRGKERYATVAKMLQDGASNLQVLAHDPYVGLQCCSAISRYETQLSKPQARPDMKVYLIYGTTDVGKTHSVHYDLGDGEEIYVRMPQRGTDWWDGYNSQIRTVLFDDFVSDHVPLPVMLQYLHQFPMKGQVKGGTVNLNYNRVFITSNHSIESWYRREQADIDLRRNYEALLRRIPPEHRCHAVAKTPAAMMRPMSWAQYRGYQTHMADQARAVQLQLQPALVDEGVCPDATQLMAMLKRMTMRKE